MKPLNKFRLLTNAPFYLLIRSEEETTISLDTVKKFFHLDSDSVLNGKAPLSFKGKAFMPMGGLN